MECHRLQLTRNYYVIWLAAHEIECVRWVLFSSTPEDHSWIQAEYFIALHFYFSNFAVTLTGRATSPCYPLSPFHPLLIVFLPPQKRYAVFGSCYWEGEAAWNWSFQNFHKTWTWALIRSRRMCMRWMQIVCAILITSLDPSAKSLIIKYSESYRQERTNQVHFPKSRMLICFLHAISQPEGWSSLSSKVNHLHDFVRETALTTEEWM